MNRKLEKSLRQSNKKKEDKVILLSGELGIPLNGQKLVEVPNRQGFVFVRLKNNTSELIQAYNTAVSPIYGLPVLVSRSVGVYKVVGRNVDRYTNQWGQAPYLPKHGAQHSFNPDINIGGDIVWVYSPQFMPLLAYPSGSNGSPQLSVSPYFIRDMNGAWKYVGNTGTPDTTPYNPTTGSRAVMGLVYLDTVSGNPQLLINSGTYIDASLTGSNQIVDYIPRVTNPNWIPLAGIRLVSGSTQLSWNNVYDVRPFLQVSSGSGTSSGGGSSSELGVMAWDEGIPLGTGTVLNFVGTGITATLSGTVVNINVSGSGGSVTNNYITNPTVGLAVQDDGVFVASGTVISFDNNLYVGVSGTVIHVSSPISTYQRFERPIALGGSLFKVPDGVYASGSLGVFYDGQVQLKGSQYEELIYSSGTYQLLFSPATGSVHMVSYGVPCIPQVYVGITGANLMVDSFGSLLVDSLGNQIVDSNG